MKFWVKILVAVCVVIVAIFAVWAFFFREKDEVQAYNRTCELIDYKQSLGIRDKLIQLELVDYVHNDPTKVIGSTTEVEKNIHRYRDLCLSTENITNYGELVFCSYFVMDEYVNELISYYLPYTRGDSVRSKSLNALKDNIEDYIQSLKKFNSAIDTVVNQQSVIEGSEVELGYLLKYYENLYDQYRLNLHHASNVILSLVEYIDISVYSDDFKIDTKFALNDAFARTLIVATSVDAIQAADYSNHVYVIMNTIEKYDNGENIFTSKYSEYDFLYSYNRLYNDYKGTLNHVYSQNLTSKQQMADGSGLSEILENAQSLVTTILNVIGF